MMRPALIAALALLPLPALAADLPPGVTDARLTQGWVEADGSRRAALIVELMPRWKTYWREPGEAGVPPLLDWSASDNLAPVRIDWPAPQVFDSAGVVTLGYHDRMVLPLRIAPATPGEPIAARLHVDLGVCEDICVPVSLDLAADWAAAGTPPDPGPDAELIRAALAAVPQPAAPPTACTVEPIRDGMRVTARFAAAPAGTEAAAVETDQKGIWVSPAIVTQDGQGISLRADLVPPEGKPFDADLTALRFTLLGADSATESPGCP
ncbi:protein-disulfide reductase DsbD domain-containing protein [Paracoccus sp. p3-h83]|uniref:protein-disulfide reductase DsbD domain-containing protein n=1 Tax=Paracoccus sp. p3-h83 TaxID=3342805 RepID=UPI0035B7AA4C